MDFWCRQIIFHSRTYQVKVKTWKTWKTCLFWHNQNDFKGQHLFLFFYVKNDNRQEDGPFLSWSRLVVDVVDAICISALVDAMSPCFDVYIPFYLQKLSTSFIVFNNLAHFTIS